MWIARKASRMQLEAQAFANAQPEAKALTKDLANMIAYHQQHSHEHGHIMHWKFTYYPIEQFEDYDIGLLGRNFRFEDNRLFDSFRFDFSTKELFIKAHTPLWLYYTLPEDFDRQVEKVHISLLENAFDYQPPTAHTSRQYREKYIKLWSQMSRSWWSLLKGLIAPSVTAHLKGGVPCWKSAGCQHHKQIWDLIFQSNLLYHLGETKRHRLSYNRHGFITMSCEDNDLVASLSFMHNKQSIYVTLTTNPHTGTHDPHPYKRKSIPIFRLDGTVVNVRVEWRYISL